MTDFHIHSSFCDGKDSPAELAAEAYRRGFTALGFSGHSYTPFDTGYCMSPEGTREYIAAVTALKEQYAPAMAVYCGVEQDYFAPEPEGAFDYRIGSVHYLLLKDEYFTVDSSAEEFRQLLAYFDGDFDALGEAYFALVGDILGKTGADIIGHFDLITKFSHFLELRPGKRYFDAAAAAIEKLLPYGKPFEINVGAMTRGYRRSPYPSAAILREIRRQGGEIILSGDCHDKTRLGDFLPEAAQLARDCGFTRVLEWDAGDFVCREL